MLCFRFRLRTLLIEVTVLAIAFGWFRWEVEQVRKEQAVVAWITEAGGWADYPLKLELLSKDKWFEQRVTRVNLTDTPVSNLSPLAKLKNLETILLDHTRVSNPLPMAKLKAHRTDVTEDPGSPNNPTDNENGAAMRQRSIPIAGVHCVGWDNAQFQDSG